MLLYNHKKNMDLKRGLMVKHSVPKNMRLFFILLMCLFVSGDKLFAVQKIGDLSLDMTKNEVITAMGRPNSPTSCDFIYGSGDNELLIIFDNDKKVESIIIKGSKLKYKVSGIGIGSSKDQVKKAFGRPGCSNGNKALGRESWCYPSSNLYFTFKNGKVASFSLSKCRCNDLKNYPAKRNPLKSPSK